MDFYKKKVSYSDVIGRLKDLSVTSTTLNFPLFLTQNLYNIGLYSDSDNPVYEVSRFIGEWNLTGGTATTQNCGVTNTCAVNFVGQQPTTYGATNGTLQVQIFCTPQTITWTGPSGFIPPTTNATTLTGLGAGTYTIKIVDSDCNTTYKTYVLQQPQPLSVSLSTTSSQTNANVGCNGSAIVNSVGGSPPYSYIWYSGTAPIPGATTNSITSLCAGSYSVQVTDSNNTVVSQYFTITAPSSISGNVLTTTNINCNGTNGGLISVSAIGGVPPYTFTLNPSSQVLNGTSATFNNLVANTYSVLVTDSNSNTTTINSISITQPLSINAIITPTNVGCYGSTNGNLSLTVNGGTAPYFILIYYPTSTESFTSYENVAQNQNITIPNLDVGTYTISVKDSNQCTIPNIVRTIQQKPKFVLSNTPITEVNGYEIPCFGGTNTITFSTSYVTDSTTYSPPAPNTVKYFVNGVNILPDVLSNATKTLTLTAGTYTITVTDSLPIPCSTTTVITLTEPPAPLTVNYGFVVAEDNASGCGGCGFGGAGDCRQIVLDINGGIGPYSITWGDGTTADEIVSNPHCLGYGIVNVTISDSNSCSQNLSINI